MRIPYEVPASLGKEFIELEPEIVAAILRTLIAGWQRACNFNDVNAQAGEVLMTERLRDGMRSDLKTKGHPWGKKLVVLPGTESRSSSAVVIPDGRTDIPLMLFEVFLRTQEHDPHAIIECKRIDGANKHLCREYVIEGIDRFRTGKYGRSHALGFMVGYVLTSTVEAAADGINAYLKHVSRNAERLEPADLCEKMLSWVSQHARTTSLTSVRLHHAFLKFSDDVA
ncbi:hypothetical protein C8R30_10272 [Nitrosomonas nitrosa]|uniref:hypothetical protein n=1 Tax=Nitrosomonas nitrosa TaxID=52442 RepID=UPI000D49D50E|nr:hypothetical protein [Nitrosomonas nitrosa]PTR04712.1 hypothetical protein C8R30_10272 [Nitrosomonas nitrosa]